MISFNSHPIRDEQYAHGRYSPQNFRQSRAGLPKVIDNNDGTAQVRPQRPDQTAKSIYAACRCAETYKRKAVFAHKPSAPL
jgi:hypothetical protein